MDQPEAARQGSPTELGHACDHGPGGHRRLRGRRVVTGAVAERWAQHYPAWFDLVDGIVAAGPTKDNIERLLESVPPLHELLMRFFTSIEDPGWLARLRTAGLVTRVPTPEVSDDGSTVRYLPWPAAVYIAVVVDAVPEEVQPVLAEVAASENPLALHAVMGIAAMLPVELSSSLVPAIGEGVARWRGVSRPHGVVGGLLDRLVDGGAHDDALRLARSVLALDGAQHVGGDHPQEYRRLVAEVAHVLGRVDDIVALDILIGVLNGATGGGGDRSVVWLHTVDEPVRRPYDSRPVLAKEILERAHRLSGSGVEHLRKMMASGAPAVQRIALHIARVRADVDPAIVLEDMSPFANEELRVELGELVRDRWHDLGDASGRYLAFVASGPPSEMLAKTDAPEQLTRKWRGFYLQAVLAHLDREDPGVAALLDGGDVPEHDVLVRSEVRTRMAEHASSWSIEEMLTLGADELVDQIKTFTPDDDRGAPTWRGIGEALAGVVGDDIDRYRAVPAAVADIAPEVLYGAIAGVAHAARRDPIDWNVVIDAALVGVGWLGSAGDGWDDLDEPRAALRHQALAAVRARLRHDEPLPGTIVDGLIEVVATCLGDDQPHDDAPGLGVGPVGDLPYTVRNVAIDTLVELVSALARTGDVSAAGAVLTSALENERNPYVFAQGARRVHRLAADAPEWLRDHVDVVFGPPGSDDPRHRVAWEVMSHGDEPDGMLAELLALHYAAWIDTLTGDAIDGSDRRLAGHVGAPAIGGLLRADAVLRFFEMAPVEARASALAYAVPTNAAEVGPAQELWEWRASIIEGGGDPDELTAIDGWLRSEVLAPAWLIEQIDRATRLGAPLDRPDMVLMSLSELSAAAPEAGEMVLDVLERVLAQADLHRLAWSSATVIGVIDRVEEARDDLKDRVAAARATAALRLQDLDLLAAASVERA